MIDFNESMKRIPGLSGLVTRTLELSIPQAYLATTLADFVQNSGTVKPTRKILPLGSLVNGVAFILIRSSAVYHSNGANYGTLSDLTHSADVGTAITLPQWKDQLDDGKRLYSPVLVYNPKNATAQLLLYQDGPPQPQRRKTDEKFAGNLNLRPA